MMSEYLLPDEQYFLYLRFGIDNCSNEKLVKQSMVNFDLVLN